MTEISGKSSGTTGSTNTVSGLISSSESWELEVPSSLVTTAFYPPFNFLTKVNIVIVTLLSIPWCIFIMHMLEIYFQKRTDDCKTFYLIYKRLIQEVIIFFSYREWENLLFLEKFEYSLVFLFNSAYTNRSSWPINFDEIRWPTGSSILGIISLPEWTELTLTSHPVLEVNINGT